MEKNMTTLTKTTVLAAFAPTPILHTVDGVGDLYFKKLTVAEQNELAKKTSKDDNINASLCMVAYSLCDETGKRLFNDNDIKDLGRMTAEQLTQVVNIISQINGFDQSQEDIKKN